jgi:uncharacterized membrane protein
MDLHPFFVHFPIALLIIYPFLEIIVSNNSSEFWNSLKLWFLGLGLAGAGVSFLTGSIAEETLRVRSNIVGAHEFFASLTIWIFGFLFVVRFLKWLGEYRPNWFTGQLGILLKVSNFFYKRTWLGAAAFLGLISISFTGALGAALVYGPKGDFIISLAIKILGL